MIKIADALAKLTPRAKFSVVDNDINQIEWQSEDIEQPSNEAIQAKQAELQADYDSKSYARARASQFPSITDVVVALAEKEEGNDAMWQEITAQRAKVKSENPKST